MQDSHTEVGQNGGKFIHDGNSTILDLFYIHNYVLRQCRSEFAAFIALESILIGGIGGYPVVFSPIMSGCPLSLGSQCSGIVQYLDWQQTMIIYSITATRHSCHFFLERSLWPLAGQSFGGCHYDQHHPLRLLLRLHARRCTSADSWSLRLTTCRRAKTPTTIRVASDPCGKHLPPIQSRHPPRIPRTTTFTINLSSGHAQFCRPTTKSTNNIHPQNRAKLHQSKTIITCGRHLPSIQSLHPSANRINTHTSDTSFIAEG